MGLMVARRLVLCALALWLLAVPSSGAEAVRRVGHIETATVLLQADESSASSSKDSSKQTASTEDSSSQTASTEDSSSQTASTEESSSQPADDLPSNDAETNSTDTL